MPLIHSKKPSAFKKNIETEIEHGKPQKQAVAIAYSVKDKAHKYADGGEVKKSGSEILSAIEPSQPMARPDLAKQAAMTAKKLPTAKEAEEGHLKQSALRSQEREADRKSRGGKYADGGEVSGEMHVDAEPDVDDELHNMMGEELIQALESKDSKRIMQSLEACVLSCMNKGMDDGEE